MLEQKFNVQSIGLHVWDFIKYLWSSFTGDSCQTTAAALTYQTLFALVPLMMVMYAVVAILDSFKAFGDMGGQVETFLFNNLVPENVSVIKQYLQDFSSQARNLGVPSLILLGGTSFMMLFTIERAFNEIWKVKEARASSQRILMYWLVLTVGPILVIAGLGINAYMRTLPLINGETYDFGLLLLMPLFLSASMFTLIFSYVPNCSVPFRHALTGGIVIAVIFELAKILFASVMSRSSFQVIYGAFAAVPLFLLWIYVSWTIVLIGAEFVKSLGMHRFDGDHELEAPLFQMIFLIELFHKAHQKGDVVTEDDIRAQKSRINLDAWTEYKAHLISLNLIRIVDKGGMILARDLRNLTIWDLYQNLPWQLPRKVKGEKRWEKKLSQRFTDLYAGNEAALQGDLESMFTEKGFTEKGFTETTNA